MVTIAVAARGPGTQKRYRALLVKVGVEAHYVTDLDSLARCVKSRPVDLILFDLDDPILSAKKWLDQTRQDADLELTPVLWIGSGILPAVAGAVDAHRPGLRLSSFPDQEMLSSSISALVGRTSDPSASNLKPADWKPEDHSIDHALSIFADPNAQVADDSETRHAREHPPMHAAAKTPHEKPLQPAVPSASNDYDWFVAEMNKAGSERQQALSDSSSIEASAPVNKEERPLEIPSRGSSESDDLVLDVTEVGSMRVPILDDLLKKDGVGDKVRSSCRTEGSHRLDSETGAMVDQVAARVASQLAAEIVRNLDHDAIRRAVEAAMTKPQ